MQLKLRLYSEHDRETISRLWNGTFYDTRLHRERFFDDVLPHVHCIITEYYRKPRAMFCLIPATLCGCEAFYLYGLAVDPEYRGLGIATTIMKRLFRWCDENSFLLYVIPHSTRLFRFFKFLDMEPALYYSYHFCKHPRPTPKGTNMIIKDISDDEYLLFRHRYFRMNPGATPCEEFVRFGLRDIRESGGRVARISFGYARFAAVFAVINGCVVLNEALACDEDLDFILPYIQYRYKCRFAISFSWSRDLSEKRFNGFVYCGNKMKYEDICKKYTGEAKC